MKLKKNLSIFLTTFSLLGLTICISSCSEDSPEIDNSDHENPDNGNGEENYISELELISFDKKTDEDESQVVVRYALNEHISEAKLAISSSQSNNVSRQPLSLRFGIY